MKTYDDIYPRPLLQRDSFFSLNGVWTCNGKSINVPFPKESALSGYVDNGEEILRYQKRFTLPFDVKDDEEVILHFGAVDQIADVLFNDRPLIHHEGGYLPFEIDVTPYLLPENLIEVIAIDQLDPFYPYGKQCEKPHGMWYTPVSGIWQSVWIEKRPKDGIRDLKIRTDEDHLYLSIDSDSEEITVILKDGNVLYEGSFRDKEITIDLSDVLHECWSPSHPKLYDILLRTKSEEVRSYCGFRKIELRKCGNYPRLFLNGEPLFLNGLLDQGYWPDGIFLPGDPDAYAKDIERIKDLGYNLLRKHIKVEPEIFYHECDKQGILVMQDMVNNGIYSFFGDTILPTIGISKKKEIVTNQKRFDFFLKECKGTIKRTGSHPCVFSYTIYNEGWGQQGSGIAYDELKKLEPEMLFDTASGWFRTDKSDFDSKHIYFRNKVLMGKERALLLSECGGFTRSIEGHLYRADKKYGYGKTDSEKELTDAIVNMHEKMTIPSIQNGLVGVVMTQISDVEEEINGLFTYDREITKVGKEAIRKINSRLQTVYEEEIKGDS